MKNYFLPGLSPGQKEKLQNAAVPFWDFVDEHGASGIVVEETDMAKVTETLSAIIDREEATMFEGIVRATLRFSSATPAPTPRHTVTVADWNGRQKEKFVKAAEEILLPIVGKDIVLSVPHQKTRRPEKDGRFWIYIWSSPEGVGERKNPPEKIFGISVDCRDWGFLPSGQGVAIVDPETNWAVGEIVGENLYIHYDICEVGTPRELEIFRRLLEEVVIEMTTSFEEKADRQRGLAEERRQRSRQEYIRECSRRFEKTVEGTKKAITDGHEKIHRLQEELVRAIRETSGSERKLVQLESCRGGEEEKYLQEYEKLLQVSKVVDVHVGDGVVKVFTDTLYCTDPRTSKIHEIGKFRIEINTSGSNSGVRWFNLTRQVDGYERGMHAPHVFPTGKACLGNTQEIFPELIANFEFAAAAMVAIQFVESVNTDDGAGKYVHKWPVAEPAERKV